jgi:hypothetical protein
VESSASACGITTRVPLRRLTCQPNTALSTASVGCLSTAGARLTWGELLRDDMIWLTAVADGEQALGLYGPHMLLPDAAIAQLHS